MNQINRILWGLILIIIGFIIGTNSLEITNINIFFNGWWTLFIIIPCFVGLFSKKDQFIGNFIGLIIGIILLLSIRNIIDFDTMSALIIPFIFIIIGLSIIFNSTIKNHITEKVRELNKDDVDTIVATFSEQNINRDNEKFKGISLDTVFGSINFDLKKAEIDQDCFIKSSSIFGGIKILVPDNINVQVKSTAIFGGVTNKTSNKKENKKTIYIESFCLFGGLEIK